MQQVQPSNRRDRDNATYTASLASRLLIMSVATALLYLFAYFLMVAPCWSLYFLAAIVAWPIWHYQQEYALFQRRAILAWTTTEDSAIRSRFWNGKLYRIFQVFVALVLAFILLIWCVLLEPWHWLLLAIDALTLALLVGVASQSLAGQVKEKRLGIVVRRWLPLFNLAFLSISFLLIDFYVGVANTSDMVWHAVAEQAYGDQTSIAACPMSGFLTGVLAAFEQLSWHLAQIFIPNLPNALLRLAAWALFLLPAALFAYIFSRFQLGIVGLLDARKLRLTTIVGEGDFSKGFVAIILVYFIPYLYGSLMMQDYDWQREAQRIVSLLYPCKPDQTTLTTLEQQFESKIDNTRIDVRQDAEKQVDTHLDQLFSDVEHGIDQYLDWYFTVIGEYERLAVAATGDLGQFMIDKLERQLFAETHFNDRLETVNLSIIQTSEHQMSALHQRLGHQADVSVQDAQPCDLSGLDLSAFGELERDRMRASAAGSGALITVISSKILAKKTAAAAVSKVAATKSFTAAAGLLGKVSIKKGGSILLSVAGGAALCAPGGPLALLCGIVAGTVVWFTLDKVFIEIDEVLFRDEMRSDILAILKEEQAELASDLKTWHNASIDAMALDIQRNVNRLFTPARDGW